jgi:thymidylate kinase
VPESHPVDGAHAKTIDPAEAVPPLETLVAAPHSIADFLQNLFRFLDRAEVRYCVLHSWSQLPRELSNDLDLAIHPRDKSRIFPVFEALRQKGYCCFQCLNHSKNGQFFVFFWVEGTTSKTAAVDIVFDHRRSGRVLSASEEIVAERRRRGEFWIASPRTEFAYLLAKKAWKGGASVQQSVRLRMLVEEIGTAEAERLAAEIFPPAWKKRAVQACLNGSITRDLAGARSKFWTTAWSRHPLTLTAYLAAEGRRVAQRWMAPTGVCVAILGPDGVGKSTIISGLRDALRLGFWGRHRLFHWRPQFLFRKKDTGINTAPHGKPPRGVLMSMAYLSAFFLDHWAGYFLSIRRLLARSNFVVFDRYFHDVLVDPRRYRYGGPRWFARLLSRLAPEPDLAILVDAPSDLILSRKNELPLDELERQRRAYALLQFRRTPKRLVNTEQGVEAAVQAASAAVTEFMRERLNQRMADWKAATQA